jgi:hypothetical protein
MKIRSFWFAAVSMAVPALALAGAYTGSFKIVEYHLDLNGSAWNLWIKPDQAAVNPNGCSSTTFYVLPMDYAYSKERYAAILAAFAAGKSIEVYVSGCYGSSPDDYPLIDQARFKVSE